RHGPSYVRLVFRGDGQELIARDSAGAVDWWSVPERVSYSLFASEPKGSGDPLEVRAGDSSVFIFGPHGEVAAALGTIIQFWPRILSPKSATEGRPIFELAERMRNRGKVNA